MALKGGTASTGKIRYGAATWGAAAGEDTVPMVVTRADIGHPNKAPLNAGAIWLKRIVSHTHSDKRDLNDVMKVSTSHTCIL